jgi:formylglycine-generating enzyme required for sulfatase activity
MKKTVLFIALLALVQSLWANNIKVEDVKYDKTTKKVSFKISWENAWRQTADFYDAAWVFAKYRTVNQPNWLHAYVTKNSTTVGGALETKESNDERGFYVRFNTDSLGHVLPTQVSFEVSNVIGLFPDFKVFAVEMVYVPKGSFYAGARVTGDEANLLEDQVLYQYAPSNSQNPSYMPLQITSESEIKNGFLVSPYISSKGISQYFPKGYDAFYCMKHEVSNEQLIAYFNSIGTNRTRLEMLGCSGNNPFKYNNITIGQDTVDIIGTLTAEGYEFTCEAGYENHPAVMTPYTLASYLNWAGLCLMTELQYVKACRGPLYPTENETAAGINVRSGTTLTAVSDTFFANLKTPNERLKRHYSAPNTNKLRRCGFAADSSTNRISSNASFYGILNMTDNAYEITISISDTNVLFNGGLGIPDTPINLKGAGVNAYIIPASFSESGADEHVVYYRGTEDGIDKYYNPYDLISPSNPGSVPQSTFRYPTGGRGVRNP